MKLCPTTRIDKKRSLEPLLTATPERLHLVLDSRKISSNAEYSVIIKEYKKLVGFFIKDGVLHLKNISMVPMPYIQYIINDLIIKNNLKKVDISKLKTLNEKRTVNTILVMNYPLLEITRLNKGDKIHNFTFFGIKTLNDKYGQCFVDEMVNTIKSFLISRFDEFFEGCDYKGRLLRDNYKNVSFGIPQRYENKFSIFNRLNDLELKRYLIQECGEYISDYALINNLNKEDIINDVLKEFKFGTGVSQPLADESYQSKLEAFYQAEIISRDFESSDKNYSLDKLVKISLKVKELKHQIVNLGVKHFEYQGVSYPILIDTINGDFKLNPTLYKCTRKGKKIIPEKIGELMEEYFYYLNKGFDFISPINDSSDWKIATDLDEQFKNTQIDVEYILKNYKGYLTKSAFYQKIQGKKGLRIYLDIKDLGLQNIFRFDFVCAALRENGFDQTQLQQVGKLVTHRLNMLMKSLNQAFPNAELSRGGDEIMIFVPDINTKDYKNCLKTVNDSIGNMGFASRLTYEDQDMDSKSLYDTLEKNTKIIKFFEERIETFMHKKGSGEFYVPRNINLYLDSYFNSRDNVGIFEVDFDKIKFDEFLKNTKQMYKIFYKTVEIQEDGEYQVLTLLFKFQKDERGNLNLGIFKTYVNDDE